MGVYLRRDTILLMLPIVLPHERIFLDNMPDTDRYSRSFMHRADVNFVTMTK